MMTLFSGLSGIGTVIMPKCETITQLFPFRDSSRFYYLDHSTVSQQLHPRIKNDLFWNHLFLAPK